MFGDFLKHPTSRTVRPISAMRRAYRSASQVIPPVKPLKAPPRHGLQAVSSLQGRTIFFSLVRLMTSSPQDAEPAAPLFLCFSSESDSRSPRSRMLGRNSRT